MICAVIPAYNEEGHVGSVVRSTQPFVDRVLVVDDGSSDDTAREARDAGAIVVRHPVNRGLGATLGTGIHAARRIGAEVVVTLDADGQHLSEEIPRFVEAIQSGNDAVLGSRMIEQEGNMPASRRLFQRLSNVLTYILFGLYVSDSQSGFRAFSAVGADALDIRTDRMEVSSEIVSEINRNRLTWTEVPITAVYTEYSLSKGQSFRVGIKTAMRLILHRLRS